MERESNECVGVFFFDLLYTRKVLRSYDVVSRSNVIAIVLEDVFQWLPIGRGWMFVIVPDSCAVEIALEDHVRFHAKRL